MSANSHSRLDPHYSLDYFIFHSELFGEYSDFGFEFISKILNVDNDGAYLISKLSFEKYEKYWSRFFPAWQIILDKAAKRRKIHKN